MIPPTTHELKNHTAELAKFGQNLPRSIGEFKFTPIGTAAIVTVALIGLIIVWPLMTQAFVA